MTFQNPPQRNLVLIATLILKMESAATTTMMMTPTEQDINEVDTDLFASSEDEAELQRRENLRARDAEINNLNTDRRKMGK